MIEGLKNELQIIYNIIIRLPIRREVKNEIKYLKAKVMQLAFAYDLQLTVDELWSTTNFW